MVITEEQRREITVAKACDKLRDVAALLRNEHQIFPPIDLREVVNSDDAMALDEIAKRLWTSWERRGR